MRLTPDTRVFVTGEKYAHVIREVAEFAFPWCADTAGIAFLPTVDGSPESPKAAPASMPVRAGCAAAMGTGPAVVASPGQLVRLKRLEREWTQRRLADSLGLVRANVADLERGHKAVTPGMALRLEAVLGVPALEWLRLQNVVDLERARRVA